MAQKKQTLLYLPPNYSYNYLFPPLGTPCLAGFLKSRGYPAVQIDGNMAYLDYLLESIEGDIPPEIKNEALAKSLMNVLYAKKGASPLYYASCLPKEEPFVPYADFTNSSFHFAERMLASPHLERYLEDEAENLYLKFFLKEKLAERILSGDFDLLGISVISPAQVLATLTLCNLLKRLKKDFPIVWGGQWPSLFRMELARWPKLARWVDGVIFDEGETPLLEYIRSLEGKQSIGEVPNFFFFENGKARFNRKRTEEDLDTLPAPDFDGMPLGRYTGAEENTRVVVTYQTSRECYWNRCTYCVDLPFPKHTYREKDLGLVVQDIRELQAKYGADDLMLSDLAMAPSYMRKFSKRLLEEKIQVKWWTFSRLDGALNRELFDLAHRAGCYRISYGFESGNQRVCDFIDKGTKLATMSRVIKDCGSSGIKVTLQTMIGLPSETLEEAMDTIAFLLEHRKYVDTVCYSIYYLTPGNYVYRDPQKNQMAIDEKDRLPFQFFLKFDHAHAGGITRSMAISLINFYNEQKLKWKRKDGAEVPEQNIPADFKEIADASITLGAERETVHCCKIPGSEEWLFLTDEHLSTLEKTGRKVA